MSLLQFIKGQISAHVAYPYAERKEKRAIREKLSLLKAHYALPFAERKIIAAKQLADIAVFAGKHVPYYQDLFKQNQFDPEKLRQDMKYLQDVPYLTKDIIREQGARLFSKPLNEVKHHVRKTGGSTGSSCFIYYDDVALDYTAATVLFARGSVGKKQSMSEMHFACKYPETPPLKDRIKEGFKSFAMNRTNIFFDTLDDASLEMIWRKVKDNHPYLLHAHPSTIYALACYVSKTYGPQKVFTLFESSGELMESYMREKIVKTFQCQTVERYGLAEFGVVAYQTDLTRPDLLVFDAEGWMESASDGIKEGESAEIVFTGFHNYLMPMFRYKTGDLGKVTETESGLYLSDMVGRTHDIITINGQNYATHYVQDVMDRVGGIQEFQIDLRHAKPKLRLVLESWANQDDIKSRITHWLKDGFDIEFIGYNDLIRVGFRSKFRHVVQS
jgi:phenylacetate-CoA ligase